MPNVEIPEEILAKLADAKREGDPRRAVFEPWQDEVLRKYWKHKDYTQVDVAKIIGRSINTCKSRYKELTSAESVHQSKPTTEPDTGATEGVLNGRDKAPRFHREGDTDGAA